MHTSALPRLRSLAKHTRLAAHASIRVIDTGIEDQRCALRLLGVCASCQRHSGGRCEKYHSDENMYVKMLPVSRGGHTRAGAAIMSQFANCCKASDIGICSVLMAPSATGQTQEKHVA